MQTNEILSAPLIDLVFDGRNKDYGAYELRKTYSKRIGKALLFTAALLLIAFGGAALAGSFRKTVKKYKIGPGIELADLPKEKIPEKIPPPEKTPKPEPPLKTERFVTPQIKDDADVDDRPPSLDNLDSARIDVDTRDGIVDDGTMKPDPQKFDNGTGILDKKPDNGSDEPFRTVEVDARFNGNWKAFLERNLNPEVPVQHDAPPGRYSVVIQFVVDKEGNVSDITPLTSHGYGMEEEALRVLRKAAKWEPAIQNGIKVKAYRRQVIVFEVNQE